MRIRSPRRASARGRNGWFSAREVQVRKSYHDTHVPTGTTRNDEVEIAVESQRAGQLPPILFYLSRDDAWDLALDILNQTKDMT